jgi:hypothetical protein
MSSFRVRAALGVSAVAAGCVLALSGAAPAGANTGWIYEGSFPTQAACQDAGNAGIAAGEWITYRCVGTGPVALYVPE